MSGKSVNDGEGGVARRGLWLALVLLLVVAAGAATVYRLDEYATGDTEVVVQSPTPPSKAAAWFAAARPHCSAGAGVDYLQAHPPPAAKEDAASPAYEAACHALAHRMAEARKTLDGVAPSKRSQTVQSLFNIVHPIADAGNETAAGPAMELVLAYWPENYQAVFHAGMAAYEKEDDNRARRHLEHFLSMYRAEDMWRSRAKRALDVMRAIQDGQTKERPKIRAH